MKTSDRPVENVKPSELPDWLELVRQQVSSLKFGTVQITVHESRVTQVERSEKVRLDRPAPVQERRLTPENSGNSGHLHS